MQVRAGEGQCEADNYYLTNSVFKTSVSNGLSTKGKRQVARQVARHSAGVECQKLVGPLLHNKFGLLRYRLYQRCET